MRRFSPNLTINACASQVELAERVGLSSTAIRRRQKVLEEEGFIRGYQAVLDLARFGLSTTVLVRVTLESQNEEALKSFEAAVIGLSIGGSMLPDVGKRRLTSLLSWRAISRLRTHSQNRTLAIAAGGADSIELRHARGREPGGPAGDFWLNRGGFDRVTRRDSRAGPRSPAPWVSLSHGPVDHVGIGTHHL